MPVETHIERLKEYIEELRKIHYFIDTEFSIILSFLKKEKEQDAIRKRNNI